MGGCYSAEMWRPAIRSTAHDLILSYPTYQPPIQDVSLQISVTNCVPLRGYTIIGTVVITLDTPDIPGYITKNVADMRQVITNHQADLNMVMMVPQISCYIYNALCDFDDLSMNTR